MSTLAEIEAAAERLPVSQKEELIQFLTVRLQRERGGRSSQSDLAEFSGAMRLAEDPVAWQQRMRGEWE